MEFGTTDKMLHMSIRIDEINPVHTRLSIFTGLAHPDNEIALEDLTRGLSGQLVIDTDALRQLIDTIHPVKITFNETIRPNLPEWVITEVQRKPDLMLELTLAALRNNLQNRTQWTFDQAMFKRSVAQALLFRLFRIGGEE